MSENVKLGFGVMRLPLTDEGNSKSINMEEFTEMVDYYMEQGFNYFDTSYAYHDETSEAALKKVLIDRYPRESYQIADKMPSWLLTKESDNEKYVNIMLERLGIDYFDVFLIHNMNRAYYNLAEKAKTFQYIQKMKEEGKARKIGISFHDKADLLEEILEKYGDIIDIVQIQLNFLDWDDPRVQSQKCHELCLKYDVEIIVMEPLKGGTILNMDDKLKIHFDYLDTTIPDLSLRFAGSRSNVSIVLSGMSNLQQVKENCETFKDFKKISNGEFYFLETIAEEMHKTTTISCTFCNYCVNECSVGIPIPDYFNLYNTEKRYSLVANYSLYGSTASTYAPASDCIECGKCVEVCTQSLDIPKLLKDVANLFEDNE